MSDPNPSGGFSFLLSDSAPPVEAKEQTPLGDLDLDLGAFGTPIDSAPPRANTQPALMQPVKEQQALDSSAPSLKPKVKKIRFPSQARAQQPAPKKSESRTHFSPSIKKSTSARSFDSEPDLEDGVAGAFHMPLTSGLAAPEDLPSPTATLDPSAPSPAPVSPASVSPASASQGPVSQWASDTPSAREIWLRARKTWQLTSRQALVFGEQGLKKGRSLADSVGEKIREHRLAAEAERIARSSSASDRDALSSCAEEQAARLSGSSVPSAAGKRILGLSGGVLQKLAAPATAAVVCALVYLGGTHLLGTDPGVLLSKPAPTDMPDLGALPKTAPDKPESEAGPEGEAQTAETSREKPAAPVEMQTEVAEMPQGLSWPSKGLIEVVTSEDELIYVDGVFTGRGPLRRIPVAPGDHEISIRADGKERSGTVTVQLNKNTRAIFK